MSHRKPSLHALRLLALAVLVLGCGSGALSRCYAQRLVFAHYMLTNQDYAADDDPTQEKKIAAYEREIQQAQAMGINGFALNAGGWLRQTYYIRYAAQMFEAAHRLHSGFRLMFSADLCCGNGIDDLEDMMRRFAGNPRYAGEYFHYRGRAVLTTFAGDKLGIDAWKKIRADLESGANPSTHVEPSALSAASAAPSNARLPIFLVPAFFWGGELPSKHAIQQGFDAWHSTIDGSFYWGIAGVPGSRGPLDQLPSMRHYAKVVHKAGKLFMAPVCLQFWGSNANRYYEYSGAAGMRAMWMNAIRVSHPDWVEIITWNDFIEGTYVSPIDDPNRYPGANFLDSSGVPLGLRGYFHPHAGAAALLPFFIQWYKTGVEPAITRDAVYFFYRTQPIAIDAGKPPIAHKYGPVADKIYITANLTAPADLRIDMGNHETLLHLHAGSADTETPFFAGTTPKFVLMRKGKTIATAEGNDPIQAAPQWNNAYYSTGVLQAL
ncbi:MAG TPA: endo-1,3-alpha-glucanase family glycosylhydrolase [Terracidiphilus sp.]|nr:endo-1,3-alpha-glucanase family glycosylhydrolase [Terracidiphilus sp.]